MSLRVCWVGSPESGAPTLRDRSDRVASVEVVERPPTGRIESFDCLVAVADADRREIDLTRRIATQPAAPPVVVVDGGAATTDADATPSGPAVADSPVRAAHEAGAAGYVRLDGSRAAGDVLATTVERAADAGSAETATGTTSATETASETTRADRTAVTPADPGASGTGGGICRDGTGSPASGPDAGQQDPFRAGTGESTVATDEPGDASTSTTEEADVDAGAIGEAVDDETDEASVTELLATLDELNAATRALMAASTPAEVASRAVDAADTVLGFPASGIRLHEETDETERLRPLEMAAATVEAAGDRPGYERGTGVHWRVFDEREPLYFDDVSNVPDDVTRSGAGAVMYLPLGEYGVFSVGRTTEGAVDRRDRELAKLLAANTATALRQADREATLRARERELREQRDRLEQFAESVAHDLRNPLDVVRLSLERLREERPDPAADTTTPNEATASTDTEPPDGLVAAERAVDRSFEIVDAYLALARDGETIDETEVLPLSRPVTEAWDTVQNEAATLEADLTSVVVGDPERLRTLFENLFRNAVEHAGDSVTVTVEETATGFRVRDDGPGLDPDAAHALFEDVPTDDETTVDGAGLGLARVHQIVTAHGWRIETIDDETAGATFAVHTTDR
ncbi:ATP-binding protein [Halobaculum sp. MBLA0147]|uniref:ATP-binding protein n=1 Tax=Halobaculum sp. MBLA0147 TaxID=3079934 RepID=UPI003523206A